MGDDAPEWVTWTANVFPVKHFTDGIQAGYVGLPFDWSDVLVVGAWGLAGLLLAIRFFSWQPKA
jgi:hypothetical protein